MIDQCAIGCVCMSRQLTIKNKFRMGSIPSFFFPLTPHKIRKKKKSLVYITASPNPIYFFFSLLFFCGVCDEYEGTLLTGCLFFFLLRLPYTFEEKGRQVCYNEWGVGASMQIKSPFFFRGNGRKKMENKTQNRWCV